MPRKHSRRDPKPTLFGQKLRRVRLAIGWTQERMAQYLELSRVMVSWYESGIVGRPSLGVLRRFRELEVANAEAASTARQDLGDPTSDRM